VNRDPKKIGSGFLNSGFFGQNSFNSSTKNARRSTFDELNSTNDSILRSTSRPGSVGEGKRVGPPNMIPIFRRSSRRLLDREKSNSLVAPDSPTLTTEGYRTGSMSPVTVHIRRSNPGSPLGSDGWVSPTGGSSRGSGGFGGSVFGFGSGVGSPSSSRQRVRLDSADRKGGRASIHRNLRSPSSRNLLSPNSAVSGCARNSGRGGAGSRLCATSGEETEDCVSVGLQSFASYRSHVSHDSTQGREAIAEALEASKSVQFAESPQRTQPCNLNSTRPHRHQGQEQPNSTKNKNWLSSSDCKRSNENKNHESECFSEATQNPRNTLTSPGSPISSLPAAETKIEKNTDFKTTEGPSQKREKLQLESHERLGGRSSTVNGGDSSRASSNPTPVSNVVCRTSSSKNTICGKHAFGDEREGAQRRRSDSSSLHHRDLPPGGVVL
jgi:hypothetical protein